MQSKGKAFSILLVMLVAACSVGGCGRSAGVADKAIVDSSQCGRSSDEAGMMRFTVVCDNNPFAEGLRTSWGFSCLVECKKSTTLFDTGSNYDVLSHNMSRLGIDPKTINAVVLSHAHSDHTGGLPGFLRSNPRVEVYVPASLPSGTKDLIRNSGAHLIEASGARSIYDDVYTTGEMGKEIKEQALVVQSEAGLVVITGCAHPGVVDIVRVARDLGSGEVALVMGGFHLGNKSSEEIDMVISEFKAMGVSHVGPCHCTGQRAMAAFLNAYGGAFFKTGVGKTISDRDLEQDDEKG